VVDNQVVAMEFSNGATATLTMHGHSAEENRTMRYDGTRGSIRGVFGGRQQLELADHRTGRVRQIDIPPPPGGHGGGDHGIMESFVEAVVSGRPGPTEAAGSLEGHLLAFAAEQSRATGETIDMRGSDPDEHPQHLPRVGCRRTFAAGGSGGGARWEEPSSLEAMTVGALAGHLLRSVTTLAGYLAEPPAGFEDLIDPAGYLLSIDGSLEPRRPRPRLRSAQAIRRRATDEAQGGPGRVLARWDGAVEELSGRLATEPPTRAVRVLDGRIMLVDDYLVTRLIEMLIHADDLAVSIGAETPAFPAAAWQRVIDTLVGGGRPPSRCPGGGTRHDEDRTRQRPGTPGAVSRLGRARARPIPGSPEVPDGLPGPPPAR
jgi:hypothetical protein